MGIEPTHPSDPAVGAELVVTIAAGKAVILRSLAFQFNTSAAVANRIIRLSIDDGSALHTYWWGENNVAQTATITSNYSFSLGYAPVVTAPTAVSTFRAFALPYIVLQAGWRFYTQTAALDAGDQIANVFYQLQDVNPQTTSNY